ncbi:MAG: RNP-1 like protein RNA-binding protein [Candidatus Giovannonibacteria bacterium GW2011_GWB1_47_6b]|uniref:RNP-1 like protein RNA-binding protein n=2 Tax=Parcubacteria group TaxID=1794811 RepID=A0A0G1T3N3_9BACT|nr:MAG: RNP-1 like protein RNA-binding protein [Candidatus Giovannonibacteria bacterium GW2011_GWB1_47_6b]
MPGVKLQAEQMSKRLYIGSLSYDTTDESLKNAFSQAGAVNSATVMIDKVSGRSRGFAFVEMENDDEAQKAIEMLNGKELDGRTIIVNEARPMTDRPARSGGFGGGRGGFGGGRGGFGGGHRDY